MTLFYIVAYTPHRSTKHFRCSFTLFVEDIWKKHSPPVEDCPSRGSPRSLQDDISPPPINEMVQSFFILCRKRGFITLLVILIYLRRKIIVQDCPLCNESTHPDHRKVVLTNHYFCKKHVMYFTDDQ